MVVDAAIFEIIEIAGILSPKQEEEVSRNDAKAQRKWLFVAPLRRCVRLSFLLVPKPLLGNPSLEAPASLPRAKQEAGASLGLRSQSGDWERANIRAGWQTNPPCAVTTPRQNAALRPCRSFPK